MCSINTPLNVPVPAPLSSTEPFPIYMDYNATTPLCKEAWEAMTSVKDDWGNPSSTHPFGLAAKHTLNAAREKAAKALEAQSSSSIIFTSGGTESNNLAIIGGALAVRQRLPERNVVVLSSYEHPAVEEVAKHLESHEHFIACRVKVDPATGVLSVPLLREALFKLPNGPQSVALVTIMFANNEIGSVNPIKELCALTKELCGKEAVFHTDAAQAIGKVPVSVKDTNVDLLSVCGHKFYAPKGSGALYVRSNESNVAGNFKLLPTTFGAGHEFGIRPGTENVLLAAAMSEALLLATETLPETQKHLRATRDAILYGLRSELDKCNMGLVVNGSLETCLPNTLNCALFKKTPNLIHHLPVTYISAARLIISIGHAVCISAGSACHSSAPGEEIPVSTPLQAVGVDLHRAIGTLRISTGRYLSLSEAHRGAVIIGRKASQQFSD